MGCFPEIGRTDFTNISTVGVPGHPGESPGTNADFIVAPVYSRIYPGGSMESNGCWDGSYYYFIAEVTTSPNAHGRGELWRRPFPDGPDTVLRRPIEDASCESPTLDSAGYVYWVEHELQGAFPNLTHEAKIMRCPKGGGSASTIYAPGPWTQTLNDTNFQGLGGLVYNPFDDHLYFVSYLQTGTGTFLYTSSIVKMTTGGSIVQTWTFSTAPSGFSPGITRIRSFVPISVDALGSLWFKMDLGGDLLCLKLDGTYNIIDLNFTGTGIVPITNRLYNGQIVGGVILDSQHYVNEEGIVDTFTCNDALNWSTFVFLPDLSRVLVRVISFDPDGSTGADIWYEEGDLGISIDIGWVLGHVHMNPST